MGSGWPEANLYLRVSLISSFAGYILFLVGFSTDVWQEKDHHGSNKQFGLWVVWVYQHSRDYTGIVDAMENPVRLGTEGEYGDKKIHQSLNFDNYNLLHV